MKVTKKQKRPFMSSLISIITLLLIGYVGLGVVLYFMQSNLTYKPTREVLYNPGDINLEYEKVRVETSDGLTITGWFVPRTQARFTVLFCHGNGGNISHRLETINIFNQLGLNCLVFDYRGYGDSQGNPDEAGTYLDAQGCYDWLVKVKKVLPANIIIFGRSLGAAVAANLAVNVEKSAVIIESAFTSYEDIAQKFYPYLYVRPFVRFKYNTLENVKKLDCPVLFIHSKNDELVPYEFGQKLFESANEPKKFIEIFGSHNNGFLHSGQTYTDGIKEWLKFISEYESPKAESKSAE